MRKKFAMRWRRQAIRRGAEIQSEGMVFSKEELRENGLTKSDNAFQIKAKYKRNVYSVADTDMLKAYKLLSWCMDVADEEELYNEYSLCGVCIAETGKANWRKE